MGVACGTKVQEDAAAEDGVHYAHQGVEEVEKVGLCTYVVIVRRFDIWLQAGLRKGVKGLRERRGRL